MARPGLAARRRGGISWPWSSWPSCTLAADYLSAAGYALLLAPCLADVAFGGWSRRGFPVSYRRKGNAAHLDLGGERRTAIVRAVADQLGLEITESRSSGWRARAAPPPCA